jgi:hypothetical protein
MQRGRAEEEDEMMTKMIAPIALALVLGALPAGAGPRHHERGNGKVEKLAYLLESAAEDLYRDAARHSRHRGRREWRALHALQRFDHRADRFLEQVVRHGIHHPRTRHGFERLERAFLTAEARRSDLRRARRLRDEFEHVEHLMRKLDRRLAEGTDYGRPRRHAVVRPEARHYLVSFRFSY